jgi:ubiquinone/menaquinone biosynthesis C-methylase UbiE
VTTIETLQESFSIHFQDKPANHRDDYSEDYEDYNITSQNYDKTRIPIGIEIILGCVARAGKPLDDIVLLDAGCGTGNYARVLVDHVHRVEAVDRCPGMIAQASRKLQPFQDDGRVAVHRAEIDDLPLAEATIDAVMVNQVLHHIADDPEAGFPRLRQVFEEFARVLRPHGPLVINTSTRAQLLEGLWYAGLIPEAVELMQRRYAPLDLLEGMLRDCGFTPRGRIVPTDAVLQGNACFDPGGPLSKEWRDGDSSWALVTDQQLERVLSRVTRLKQDGGLQAYFARMDARRLAVGQTTFLFATRD